MSREIPKLKKAGEDTTAIMAEMKELSGARSKSWTGVLSDVEENWGGHSGRSEHADQDVQDGEDDSANVELEKVQGADHILILSRRPTGIYR